MYNSDWFRALLLDAINKSSYPNADWRIIACKLITDLATGLKPEPIDKVKKKNWWWRF